jgi:hypothetical protein
VSETDLHFQWPEIHQIVSRQEMQSENDFAKSNQNQNCFVIFIHQIILA